MIISKRNGLVLAFLITALAGAGVARAIDGGTLRVNPRNGWKAFEVITVGDNPAGDGFNWSMPGTFDGIGAQLTDGGANLRLQVNHETGDATISEVNLDLANFKTAISNVIGNNTTGGVSFVTGARQAYDRWSADGGVTWTNTTNNSNTSFSRYCSGQSYAANTYGENRGFVDEVYITGEEVGGGRLFAIDLAQRDFYQLSGTVGSGTGGLGGMPFDAWENAALLDTGETDHIALLLSPDGGTQQMKMFVGEKGKDVNGNASNSFLARNGLAFGSYYYLNDALPGSGTSADGTFDATAGGSLASSKLEDVDTSPSNPDMMVLGDQDSGTFTFDFDLDFTGGSFNPGASGFSITKIHDHNNDTDNAIGDADNVDWSARTILDGTVYGEGLIFINEDTGTGNGEIWMSEPDGSGLVKIGDTTGISGATESTGILDISQLVGFNPGSIVLTNNQGSNSSLSVLINPGATRPCDVDFDGDCDFIDADTLTGGGDLVAGVAVNAGNATLDSNFDGVIDSGDLTRWRESAGEALGFAGPVIEGDLNVDGDVDSDDLTLSIIHYNGATGSGNVWSQGDSDGDGDTDTGDITKTIINFTGFAAGDANVPDLIYDPTTGNVTIDADGADLISFSLQAGPFNAADFGDLPAGLTDNIATQIGWTSFNLFSGLTGTADLGSILPAGLDEAQLLAALQTASYGLALSGGGGGGRFEIIIPEPGTIVLIALGATIFLRKRHD